MPWMIVHKDDQWCVYKHDAEHNPVGDTLGCHPSEEAAQKQMAALYANEPSVRARVVKSTDTHVTLGGYGVVYGGADLEGETFTKETDFWLDRLSRTPPVLYQHGKDKTLKTRMLGHATVEPQDAGLWVEAQIALSDEYAEGIRELAEEGKLGWSSGAVGHLTAREGKTITVWPIAEFSLTPTPAEPRTLGVHELRSLAETEPYVKAILPEAGEEPAADATESTVKAEPSIVMIHDRETNMAEEVKATPQVDVAAIAQAAAEAAVTKAIAELKEIPAVEKTFNTQPEGKDHPEVKDFGDWCIAVQRGDTKRLETVYGSTKTALAESDGNIGGYLVPPEYSRDILRIASENSVVRPRARVIPMTSREFNYPALDYTGTTAGQPHRLGGVVATWTEEAGTKTETEPTFKTIKLQYHELSGYTVASNMLRQDAGPTLATLLTGLFGEAIAWYEDYAFLRGTGSGQPLGIFNSSVLVNEVAGATTFVLADAAGMLAKFLTSSPSAGVWVAHPTAITYLVALADGSGAANNVIWIPNARESLPMTLFGKPVIFSEKMPVFPASAAATAVGGMLLADFSYYLIGARTGIQIDFSEHYKFINNQGTWRFTEYVDGQPALSQAVYLADGSNTMSPFISLAGA